MMRRMLMKMVMGETQEPEHFEKIGRGRAIRKKELLMMQMMVVRS